MACPKGSTSARGGRGFGEIEETIAIEQLEKIKAAAKGARFPANWISPPASSGANTAHACQTMVVQVAALRAAVRGTICASRLGMVGSAKPRATPKKNMQTISTVSLVQPSV